MNFNLILAGVGGQGILTIAHLISRAAMRLELSVKQSEVHGMSQRGGAVQSHVRFADHPVYSDLIPLGEADMVLAVEPLEALRYVEYVRENGIIVSAGAPLVNIPNYPPIEEVLDRIASFGDHVIVNTARLARLAGSARAENMVMLGAAACCMKLPHTDWDALINDAFASKGERIVESNQRAFQLGFNAARLFRDALEQGLTSPAIRQWLDACEPAVLSDPHSIFRPSLEVAAQPKALTEAEVAALDQIFSRLRGENRPQLYEQEVYAIVELVGGLLPPRHEFIPMFQRIDPETLNRFPGDRVVLKVVSAEIVHKSDAGGVLFVRKTADEVNHGIHRLSARSKENGVELAGVLIVECVEHDHHALGGELFVGIRATREFGPVIAAGLGGIDTEFLAERMHRGLAVAKAPVGSLTPEAFLDMFKNTAAYDLITGNVRGHERIVHDGELLRCFRAFMAVARRFCQPDENGVGLTELEVNPFAFVRGRMIPLDGRGRCDLLPTPAPPRSPMRVRDLLEPNSIAVVGVSAKRANFGRIIMNNIQECDFPKNRLYIVKTDATEIDGVPCVKSIADLPQAVDLLVAAAGAEHAPALVRDVLETKVQGQPCCSSVILIPGALGEKEGTAHIQTELKDLIASARARGLETPVFLGGNCMGVRSRPGGYDTFFVPKNKLDPRRNAPAKRVALVSQSGAFIITRLSNLEFLDPALSISLGNQVDLTVSDFVHVLARRDDIDCVGVYMEGFNDLDGLEFLRAVEHATHAGKVVVFYKAGRTPAGRTAAQGHTASLAGDYDVCDAAVAAAGAIVTETFKEFEQLLELATVLHGKTVRGRRLGILSNAGYEAVGMADAVKGARYRLDAPPLSGTIRDRLQTALARYGLNHLVNPRNPLDLTPMANDEAYEDCMRIMLDAEEIDALIVGCVPMTPQLLTLPGEIDHPASLARRVPAIFRDTDKPLAFVVDCAEPYDAFARAVRAAGVPVFRSADQAVRSLGRYLCHRVESAPQSSEFTHSSARDTEIRTAIPALQESGSRRVCLGPHPLSP